MPTKKQVIIWCFLLKGILRHSGKYTYLQYGCRLPHNNLLQDNCANS